MSFYPFFGNRRSRYRMPETQISTMHTAPGPSQSASVRIDNQDQFGQLRPRFKRLLCHEFGTQTLSSRLAPALLEQGYAALFGLQEHIHSDQADELLERMQQSDYVLHDPARVVLAPHLLLALSRAPGVEGTVLTSAASRSELTLEFQRLVQWAWRHGASDIHINVSLEHPTSSLRFSIGGLYVAPVAYQNMSTRLLMDMLAVVWMDIEGGNGAVFDPYSEQQGRCLVQVDGRALQLRWASIAADIGPSVCLRVLDLGQQTQLPQLETLGYLPAQIQQFERLMMAEGGAIVLAGTVGSGKSTTLAALVQRIPSHRKIVTLEDPVEFRLPQAVQNSLGRRLDTQAHDTFASKLRALKRSAMQDVLLGEIRDVETGRAFMDLSGAGVSVYTTLHAASASGVSERLASDFIGVSRDFLALPGLLKLLVYQALLPRLCQHCALGLTELQPQQERPRDWVYLASLLALDLSQIRFRSHTGCEQCRPNALPEQFGYAGRQVVAELLEPAALPDASERIRRALPLVEHTDCFPPVVENAWHYVREGRVSLFDVEARFGAVDTFEKIFSARQKVKVV